MIENPKLRKMKRVASSGVSFSKLYFSKPTSVVLVTVYVSALVLAFGTLGLSKLINPVKEDTEIPTIAEVPFTFLPADNVEVPGLGEVDGGSGDGSSEDNSDGASEDGSDKASGNVDVVSDNSGASSETRPTENYRAPATVQVPVVVEVPKETVKEVVKTVEVEVVKEVVKDVPSVVDESKIDENIQNASDYQPEQVGYDNYDEPEVEENPGLSPAGASLRQDQKDNDE